jgi:DNA-binding transcriptional LysR family regulator
MNVDLRQLRSFVTIVRCGNFTRAAQQLGVSQPALSLSLRQLESALGLRLLDRTTRSIGLTADGLRLLPTAERLLIDFEAAIRDVKEAAAERRSMLTVACLPSLAVRVLPEAITKFQKQFPDVAIQIRDGTAAAVMRAVRQAEADIGMSSYWQAQPDLEFRPIAEDRFVLVCPSGHRLAQRSQVPWSVLKNESFLMLTPDTSMRRLLDDTFGDFSSIVQPAFEVGSWATLCGLLEAGLGITALPDLAVPMTDSKTLVQVPLVEPVVTRDIGIVARHGSEMTSSAQGFLDVLDGVLGESSHRLPRRQRRRA